MADRQGRPLTGTVMQYYPHEKLLMAKNKVLFSISDQRMEADYDRSQLRLGASVYVSFDEQGHPLSFSPGPGRETRRFVVQWIAPSDWYVPLVDRFEIRPKTRARILEECGEMLPKDLINKALGELSSRVRLEFLYKTSEVERNPIFNIETVLDRLDLCRRLCDPEVEKALFHHQRPLMVYLLLTCFDRLGQPADWVDFGGWLVSKDHEDERQIVLVDAPKVDNPIQLTIHLHKSYLDKYGTASAFFRFMRELLPDKTRRELLNSIIVVRNQNPPGLGRLPDLDDDQKLRMLYTIRNDYTHRAFGIPGVGQSILPDLGVNWVMYSQTFREFDWDSVMVHDWPNLLQRTVRTGLAEYVRLFAREDRRERR